MGGRSQDGRREEGGRGVQTSPQGRLPGSRELSPSPERGHQASLERGLEGLEVLGSPLN